MTLMREREFRELCEQRGLDEEEIESAVRSVLTFEEFLAGKDRSLEEMTIDDVKEHISELIDQGQNTWERLTALARYSDMITKKEVYVYFTSVLGGRTVLPSISERLADLAGAETRDKIFTGIEAPPLGSPPEEFPRVTMRLVERLERELGSELCHDVLAGNHHRIPVENFEKHKLWLEEEGSIECYLKRLHDAAVAELEEYLREGKIWYEQEITPEVVEFVRGNQEILSGVREGDWIYMTKIPYAPKDYLTATDPVMKRYHGCHCPLAREAILMEETDIPLTWCYCSGGYGKLKFDVVFGEPTEVEVLESTLAGDERCRFRVKIPESKRD